MKNLFDSVKNFLYHFCVATLISCFALGVCAFFIAAFRGDGVFFDVRSILGFLVGGWAFYLVYLTLSPIPKDKDRKVTYETYEKRVHKNGGSIKFISPNTVRVSVRGLIFIRKVMFLHGVPYIDTSKHLE